MPRPSKYGEQTRQISLHVPESLLDQILAMSEAFQARLGWKVSRNELIVAALASSLTDCERFIEVLFRKAEISPTSFGEGSTFKDVILEILAPLRLADTDEGRELAKGAWSKSLDIVMRRLATSGVSG